MANQEHLALLHQGVNIWNQWRQEHHGIIPNLEEDDFERANLSGADLHGVYLYNANLHRANLSGALQPHLLREIRS